jgi:hypothetical protein
MEFSYLVMHYFLWINYKNFFNKKKSTIDSMLLFFKMDNQWLDWKLSAFLQGPLQNWFGPIANLRFSEIKFGFR